ncbi:MAG: hypothetical protein WC242_01770 [Candidatus Paceibacterota bacterium]|jgi:hypothetical protein
MISLRLVNALEAANRYSESLAEYQKDIIRNIIDCALEELQASRKVEAQDEISVVRAGRQDRLRIFEEALRLSQKERITILRETMDHLRQGNFYGLSQKERRAVLKYLDKLEEELKKQEVLEKMTRSEQ